MKRQMNAKGWASVEGARSTPSVGLSYEGDPFAPIPGTYPGIDPLGRSFWSVADSGEVEAQNLRCLLPLIAAALSEVGFSWEAGPLSTWSN